METPQKEASAVQAEIEADISDVCVSLLDNLRTDVAAFKSGEKSKRFGYQRLSPFYENQRADYFFFAGYDGIGWDAACEGMFQHA